MEAKNKGMHSMKMGEKAWVTSVEVDGLMRRRLQDLGMVEGTEIECVQTLPVGSPTAYLVRGTIFAIRDDDSKRIFVSDESPNKGKEKFY